MNSKITLQSKKFAVLILLYDCEQFILRTIENCGPYVNKIFISYSALPWTSYNSKSRDYFKNRTNSEIIDRSNFIDKIEMVKGEWDTEEDQREACRLLAKKQGYDFLIVQDADEFYLPEDYKKNLEMISNNSDFEVYQTPWINFWKSTKLALVHKEHLGVADTIIGTCPLFAINLHKEIRFESRRVPLSAKTIFQLKGVCLHLSYVLSDAEIFTKISTWGHSHQVNKNWFKWKWLAWHPGKRNLNPLVSVEWVNAVPYTGALPKELLDFQNPTHVAISLTWYDRIMEYLSDWNATLKYRLNAFKRIFRKKFIR